MLMMQSFGVPLCTLMRKEIRRILYLWIQTLLPPMITMALYFIIFGHIIGGNLKSWQTVPYAQFIAPGVMMLAMLTNTYANISSSFFIEKFMHSIEEMLVSSMSPWAIVLGFVLSSMFRGMLIGFGVLVLAYFLTDLSVVNKGLTLLFMFLATAVMAHIGFLNALYARRFDDINLVPTFLLTPLIYLGGVFYPISKLPGIWQTLSWYNPLVYLIEGFRYAVLGVASVNVLTVLVSSALLVLVLFLLCVHFVRILKGVRMS